MSRNNTPFKTTLLLLFLSLFFGELLAQGPDYNVQFVSQLELSQMHPGRVNDVWGHVDSLGNEYAIVGMEEGTSIVDLSDPFNPVEIFYEPGLFSTWRDIKTYNGYAYVTTEAPNGMLIIDMTSLPDTSGLSATYFYGSQGGALYSSAHNIFIDSLGFAYLIGANIGVGGCTIYDLNQNPLSPVQTGMADDWYGHDAVVFNDTLLLSNILDGHLSIYDVSDKSNPVLLGIKATPGNFTHNAWQSSDHKYAFTTDEISGGYLAAVDISDPMNMDIVDKVRTLSADYIVPHNTHTIGDHIVTSYYSDGIVIHDVSNPENMVEVGRYDTFSGSTSDFDGCWGAYPWLPSGLILATDRTNGLFVLNPTYVQACYLEGTVTDAQTSFGINNAELEILQTLITENTALDGTYATGYSAAGSYTVVAKKIGYYSDTIYNVILSPGNTTYLDIALEPQPKIDITINVQNDMSNNISYARVYIKSEDDSIVGMCDQNGNIYFSNMLQNNYDIYAYKWGYRTECMNQINIESDTLIGFDLTGQYYDDFSTDMGWQVNSTSSSGAWERALPKETVFQDVSQTIPANAANDVSNDCGEMAFVTGNSSASAGDAESNDVENGYTELISPYMNLSSFTNPQLNFRFYWSNPGIQNGQYDTLEFWAITSNSAIFLDDHYGQANYWIPKNIYLNNYMNPQDSVQFMLKVRAHGDKGVCEAGLDRFIVYGGVPDASPDLSSQTIIEVFPNPTYGKVFIKGIEGPTNMILTDFAGRLIQEDLIRNDSEIILPETKGIYFITIFKHGKSETHKLIRL